MLDPPISPLESQSPAAWDALIESVNPAALLVVIQSRMSSTLLRLHTPEDVFQEALLHAWRDRQSVEWRGPRAFRAWLLSIAENRIRDLADRESARKRGGGQTAPLAGIVVDGASTGTASGSLAGATSTTPSRVAMRRERAAAMSAALAALPEDVREVVRLRLFEQLTMEAIAARVGIGLSAARHRFRRGAEEYQALLRAHGPTALLATEGAAGGPAGKNRD